MARVCVDATFFTILTTGELSFKRESVGLRQLAPFTTPGNVNFTKASFPGLTRLRVRVIGGGGGAGGTAGSATLSTASPGAGGGGYSESVINASALGAVETITVGAGGAGGVGAVAGSPGGASSFFGVVANGGFGSPVAGNNSVTGAAIAFGGYGAPVGVGQIAVPGGHSVNGIILSNTEASGGLGGMSGGGYGPGGDPLSHNAGGYGGGGGGVGSIAGQGAMTGGNGSNGAVFLDLFF